jgi:hypothetical protein
VRSSNLLSIEGPNWFGFDLQIVGDKFQLACPEAMVHDNACMVEILPILGFYQQFPGCPASYSQMGNDPDLFIIGLEYRSYQCDKRTRRMDGDQN